ncbi:MAG: carbohydrate ABC transporter permease [Clostridia bacterium]|nr:carbohydrate ABC transporter permease [Clostridia bacterium]
MAPRRIVPSKAIGRTLLYIALIAGCAVMLLPFVWMISSSLKTESDVFTFPIQWIPSVPRWKNYQLIWEKVPLLNGFKNSAILTVCTMVLQITTSSLAAYAFAKLEFRGRNFLFLAYVTTIAIPWQVYMVPQYIMMASWHLTDSLTGIVIMHAFTAFGVFMMRQFYMGIPNELLEAARIDGMSEAGIWIRIMVPLSKPAVATLAITSFVFEWNDFMGPRIYLSSTSKQTLQLVLRLFNTQYSSNYAQMMAAATVALIPVFIMFVFLQRYFVQGVATSGLKG